MSFGSAVALAVERIVEPIEGMHRSIAARWFRAVGPIAKPVHVAHDTVSRGVYQTIRFAGALVGVGLDKGNAVTQSTAERTQSVVNGLWGDTLGEHRLAIAMSLRNDNGDVVEPGPQLADAFPRATGHLVVLVHGLVDTEHSWQGDGSDPALLDTLQNHPSLTPLRVRYNTGRPVALNGQHLADLIEGIYRSWPVPVESVALVGHSMGGLVVRSACQVAAAAGHSWAASLTDIVTLGSPHLGAPLEKITEVARRGLDIATATRPLADFLGTRSRGIKDLRFGATALGETRSAAPLPVGVNHHFVAGVVTGHPRHPVGVVIGDLIVRSASATGGSRYRPTNAMVVGGVHHGNLAHNEAILSQVIDWLEPA